MKGERRGVTVWADWGALGGPLLMGNLYAVTTRGKEVFSFQYSNEWLRSEHAQVLDPELQLFEGTQYPPSPRPNFNLFLDSSPDRWGRALLRRREVQLARAQGRVDRRLTELDILLGVYDGHRMGALRFREDDSTYLDDNIELASPPWASLRELEHASSVLEKEGVEKDPEYGKWLQMLIAPGRSLGGQRPKASVTDEHGQLWIAKFPKGDDDHDVGAWELVLHRLAAAAGIWISEARCERFASPHHTFLTRRFDRAPQDQRLHFASALTMLARTDGDAEASYLEMADFIIRYGAHPARDLEQLWRRIVFFVCVSNTDDHLRNHGFMLEQQGWTLAPAYDMNPFPREGLALNISETDNTRDLSLVQSVAGKFRVKPVLAGQIIEEVKAAVRGWRAVAETVDLSREQQNQMAPAFQVAEDDV